MAISLMATLSSVLAQIRQNESGGNYMAQNPKSTASGAYQFVNGTWQNLTQQSGIGTQYATAASAPPQVQDAVAAYALEQNPNANSSSLWGGGPNTYPLVTEYDLSSSGLASGTMFAQGPSDTGLGGSTVYSGGAGTTSDPYTFNMDVTPTPTPTTASSAQAAAGGAGADVGFLPPSSTGGPQYTGLAAGTVNSITGWINSIEGAVGTTFKNAWDATVGQVENLALRFFIVLAAVAVIIVALWRLLDPDNSKVTAMLKAVPAAA